MHVVGQRVAVLDRVDAGVGGDPRGLIRRGVRGDALADAMRFVDDDPELLDCHHARARIDDDLDDVRAIVERLAHRAPRFFNAADHDVLVLDELLRLGRHAAELSAGRGERARRCHDARPDDPSAIDRVAQGDIAVQSRVAEVAHRGNAGLEVLTAHRDAEQCTSRRPERRDGQQHVRVVVAEATVIVLQ